MAPFKNATSREFRIPPPAGAGGFQFAGIDHDRIHPGSEFAKSVFPDERNAQEPRLSLLHWYNYADANAAVGGDDIDGSCGEPSILKVVSCILIARYPCKLRGIRSLLEPHREVPMDFCDLSCKYASFPTSEAVDGSRSFRTFIALYCKKEEALSIRTFPAGIKSLFRKKRVSAFKDDDPVGSHSSNFVTEQ